MGKAMANAAMVAAVGARIESMGLGAEAIYASATERGGWLSVWIGGDEATVHRRAIEVFDHLGAGVTITVTEATPTPAGRASATLVAQVSGIEVTLAVHGPAAPGFHQGVFSRDTVAEVVMALVDEARARARPTLPPAEVAR
jgi:hypothetical protein